MNIVSQQAKKYLIGVVILLVAIALYFFVMAQVALSSKENDEALRAELALHKDTLAQQEALIAELRENAPATACDAINETDEFQNLLSDFEKAQNDKQNCDANIASVNGELADLREALAQARSEVSDTQDASQATEALEAELAAALDENARLIAAEEDQAKINSEEVARLEEKLVKANEDNALMLSRIDAFQEQIEAFAQADSDDETIQVLQEEIAQLREENTRLQGLADEAAAIAEQEAQAEEERSFTSGDLQFTNFDTQITYCDSDVSDTSVCVDSISSTVTFNFNPNSFISLRLIDPNGNTLQRQSVAGRTITNIQFDIDAGSELPSGQYTVEFKIDDVFNKFNASESFTLAQ